MEGCFDEVAVKTSVSEDTQTTATEASKPVLSTRKKVIFSSTTPSSRAFGDGEVTLKTSSAFVYKPTIFKSGKNSYKFSRKGNGFQLFRVPEVVNV